MNPLGKRLPEGFFIVVMMKEKETGTKEEILHRVVTFLNREELDFLDNLIKDVLFTTGIKIPRSSLLRSLIDAFVKPESKRGTYSQNLLNMLMGKIKKGGK